MEAIIRRLLIVLTILGLVVGAEELVSGQMDRDSMHDRHQQVMIDANQHYADCLKVKDESSCKAELRDTYDSARWMGDAELKGIERENFGAKLLALVILVWPVYFVTRWILTGRWKARPKAAQS